MNKKEIVTLIVAGFVVLLLAGFGGYAITANSGHTDSGTNIDTSKTNNTPSDALKVGNYTLRYGNYVGISSEYDPDTDKSVDTETIIILQKDKIVIGGTSSKYVIDGTRLKVNGTSLINVTGNDQFTLEAGAGIDYKYQEN